MSILLIVLLVLLLGGGGYGWHAGWGAVPVGGIGLILLIVVILALTGHL